MRTWDRFDEHWRSNSKDATASDLMSRLIRIQLAEPGTWKAWVSANASRLLETMTRGALVLSGTPIQDPKELAWLATTVGGSLIDYHERSTPRTHLNDHIYTST